MQSARYAELAQEELRQLGTLAIAKAWLFGAALNLASPAVTVMPAVATLPRTGFYDTPGRDLIDKAANFLFRSENALYAWLLAAGLAGVASFRLGSTARTARRARVVAPRIGRAVDKLLVVGSRAQI